MNFPTIFALIFITSIGLSQSITLNCKYTSNPKYGYTCIATNDDLVTSRDDREVTKVNGQHLNGKTENDVKFFQTLVTEVNYFPKGITKFFNNLDVIEIKNGNLIEITKEDLEEFGSKLRMLWFGGNKLKNIKADLFEFNENLEKIGFDSNEIEKIDAKSFDGLKNLQSLFLRWNSCTNDEDFAENDREKVLNLIKKVEEKCKIKNKRIEVFLI